jgi:hypothetical protein
MEQMNRRWQRQGARARVQRRARLVLLKTISPEDNPFLQLCWGLGNRVGIGLSWPARDGIVKLLRGTGIDSKESIPAAYVALRGGTTALFLLGY